MTIEHIYYTSGNYTVVLTITDNEGNTARYTTYAVIESPLNHQPIISSIDGPRYGSVNTTLIYTITNNDSDNDTLIGGVGTIFTSSVDS